MGHPKQNPILGAAKMFLLVLIAGVWLNASASATWPHEPVNSTPLVDCPFSGSPSACGISDNYSSSSQDVDASAPVSPSGVIRSTIRAGNNSGGMQLDWSIPQTYREMFVGFMWKTNSQFAGRTVHDKMFFMRGDQTNGYFGMRGCPNCTQRQLGWGQNASNVDNSHACGDGGLWCYPNAGSPEITIGEWTKIEAYIKSSTTMTSRDGILRWWINGQSAGNYTNINYAPYGLNNWTWSETWDGYVNPVPSVDWHHYIDHLYISIPDGAPPVATSIQLTPQNPLAEKNKSLQFSATVLDQNSFPLIKQPAITWSTTGANSISNGLFMAGSATGDFTVTASTGSLSATATVKVMDFVLVNLKINCGDNSPSVPGWEPDLPYLVNGEGGETFDFAATMDVSGVANAGPAPLYNTVRHYNHAYSFPGCPNGNYLVRLHFSDQAPISSNRAMDYTIEGIKVIDNLNIVREAGGTNKALVKEFNVVVSDNNGLQIGGNQDAGNDVFEAGIEIIRNGTAGITSKSSNAIVPHGFRISALSNGRLSVTGNNLGSYSISVFDCAGRSVAKVDLAGREHIINGLGRGVYFVAIENKNGKSLPLAYTRIALMP